MRNLTVWLIAAGCTCPYAEASAILWNSPGANPVILAPYTTSSFYYSGAQAISNGGAIVGAVDALALEWSASLPNAPVLIATDGAIGDSVADAVNNSGDATGVVRNGAGFAAFFWSASTGLLLLPGTSQGVGINDSGEVVGVTPGGVESFLWTSSTGVVDIGTFTATGINDAGEVVGNSSGPDGAMSWTQSGGIVALARLSPGDITRAVAINNLGWIAGTDYNLATGVSNGVLWTSPSTVLILATNFSPTALNDDGQVVGSSGGYGAAIWTSANGVQPLSLNGLGITEGLSAAYGINDSGQIVGAVRTTPELETITLSCVGLTVLLLAKTVVAPQGTSAMITGATDKSVADLVVDSLP